MLSSTCLSLHALLFLSGSATDLWTPHRVADVRYVSAAVISPDGKHVAYTLSVPRKAGDDEDGASWSELHVVDCADGRARPFVTQKTDVAKVQWTSDGRDIAFLSKRGSDKFTSLYMIALEGGEARRAASLGSDIGDYSFSPDAKRVALVATTAEPEATKKAKEKGFKQEIYEEDSRTARVWIASTFDEKTPARELDLEGSAHDVHWSPTGDKLAVAIAPTPLVDDEYMRQRIHIVDVGTGKVTAKIANPGKLGAFAWSPDARWIALVSAADINDPSAGRLCLAPAQGGAPVDLLPDNQADVSQIAWQSAEQVMYLATQGVWTVLGKVRADPARTDPANGEARSKLLVRGGGPIFTGFTLSADGEHAAFVASTPEHPPEVYTMSHGDTAPLRRTDSNPWIANLRLAPQEVVTHHARDGLELEGVLIRPLDAIAGRRYPLILCVHGGPEAHESNGWLTNYGRPGQMAAARGMAVFYPNYRGSTGRGVAFSKLGQGDPAGKEFDDLVDAVDHLVSTGLVDESKVGITGGSYGGYATAWCATRYSDRFAAGVMFVGISNKLSKIGTTDIPDEEFYVHARKRVWDDWQFFLERSPIYYADKARTPLLILHGKDDPRVNNGQSRELYRHLKVRGETPVRLVFYPGEGHGNRKAAARLDYSLRVLQWMEHYLKGPGGAPPAFEIDYAEAPAAGAVEAASPAAASR